MTERIVVYVAFDPDTDEVDVNYGDEDRDIVIALLEQVVTNLREN